MTGKNYIEKEPRMTNFKRILRRDWPLHLLLLLPVILVFIYSYIPMGGLIIAFQKYKPAKGIAGSAWVGL